MTRALPPPLRPSLHPQANDGNGDEQQRTGMDNAAQITAATTRAARLAQVRCRPALPCAFPVQGWLPGFLRACHLPLCSLRAS